VRSKKTTKRSASNRRKTTSRVRKSASSLWVPRPRAIVLGVMCVMATAALFAARQPLHRSDLAGVDAQPDANASVERAARPLQLETKKTVEAKASASAPAVPTRTTGSSFERTSAIDSTKTLAADASSADPAGSAPDAQPSEPVTITGCLQLSADTFWLKDTSGVDAPKSRSWKSGFLKRRSSPVEIVDAANRLKLTNYVGQRVSATGVLMNREIRARSLQSVGTSCS